MIEALYAEFLPRFLELARARVARAIEVATRNEHEAAPGIIRELHALAGEAGLLGQAALVPLARDGEDRARRMHATRSDAEAAGLLSALRELERMIERIEPPKPTTGGKP